MATFTDDVPAVEIIPIRAVTPSTQSAKIFINLGANPSSEFIPPGEGLVTTGQALWRLYTRSVLSCSIVAPNSNGASLLVRIGSLNDFGNTVVDMFLWQIFAIIGTGQHWGLSGIELPAGQFASFQIVSGSTVAGPHEIKGSIIMRGV